MKSNKALVAGLVTLGVVIVALLVIPSFIDWSKYQAMAQQKLKEATGYDLKIGGALSISLLPSPHASVHDVSVKKASESEAFLTLESADVRLAFLPLLAGKIEISSVALDKPVLTLVTKRDGTDNWKPAEKTPEIDVVTNEPVKAKPAPSISVGALKIKDGKLSLRDEATGKTQEAAIEDIRIKADSLNGPFEIDGKIGYGAARFNVSATTGGAREGEALPVQLSLEDKDGRAAIKFSGVANTGGTPEVQGEADISYTDLGGIMTDAGMAASSPVLRVKTKIRGMLTASAEKVALTNGSLDFGGTPFTVKLDATGLKTGPKNIVAVINTDERIDLAPVLDMAEKVAPKDGKSSGAGEGKAQQKDYTLVPAIDLPKDMKADIQLRGKALEYRGSKTGAFEIRLNVAEGKGDLRLTLSEIPGGGDISLSASTAGNGMVEGAWQVSISSLKKVFADWLKLADAKTFENPAMPRRIDSNATFRAEGRTFTANVNPLSIGETKVNGTIAYTNAARPTLNLNLTGNVYSIDKPKDKVEEKKGDGKETKTEKISIAPGKFDPPQLPFDLKFDIALARLTYGDSVLSDVKAAGQYNGKGINLTKATAAVAGGTVNMAGQVQDIKNLSGIDITGGLTTSDLEGFVKTVTGKPLETAKPLGAVSAQIKAKGDSAKMAVDASGRVQGYTIALSGPVNKPFEGVMPDKMAFRVKHADFVEAMRFFSPSFGNDGRAGKPVDLAGTLSMSGKSYEVPDLKGTIGASDISGNVSADMNGKIPVIKAAFVSKNLDVGAFMGVESGGIKSSGSSSDGGSVNSGASGAPWSREALNTGFLRSMKLDAKLSAEKLQYGTWTLDGARAELALGDGALKASPIAGKLYGGDFSAKLEAKSTGEKAPLAIVFSTSANGVSIDPFMRSLMASGGKKAEGVGSFSLDMAGSGSSAAALVAGLSGKANIKTEKLIIHGIDIDKLAANIVEAFDGGWKGVLAGITQEGLSGGTTAFKDVTQSFPIGGGNMTVKDFVLETTNGNATLVSNGNVDFARWMMDIRSDIKVTQPKDVPVIGMRLAGPLNAPQKSVNSQALDSLVRNKLKDEIGDKIQEKLKGTKAEGIINQVIPGLLGQPQQPAPAPTPEATPAPAEGTQGEQPEQQQQPQSQQQTPEEQLLNGIINQLAK